MMVAPSHAPQRFAIPATARYLTPGIFAQAQVFSPDMQELPTKVNTLDDPVLVRYHTDDWSRWGE